MELTPIPENEELKCKCCKESVNQTDAFCPNCGFPLQGTDEEKSIFIGQYISKKNDKEEWERQMKNARTTLIVVGVFSIVGGLVLLGLNSEGDGMIDFVANLILGCIYFFLAWWSKKTPFGAILTGLIVYFSVQILSGFVEPESLFRGVIVKVIIVSYMIKGVVGASKVRGVVS